MCELIEGIFGLGPAFKIKPLYRYPRAWRNSWFRINSTWMSRFQLSRILTIDQGISGFNNIIHNQAYPVFKPDYDYGDIIKIIRQYYFSTCDNLDSSFTHSTPLFRFGSDIIKINNLNKTFGNDGCSLHLYRYNKLYDCNGVYIYKWRITNDAIDKDTTNPFVFIGLFSNDALSVLHQHASELNTGLTDMPGLYGRTIIDHVKNWDDILGTPGKFIDITLKIRNMINERLTLIYQIDIGNKTYSATIIVKLGRLKKMKLNQMNTMVCLMIRGPWKIQLIEFKTRFDRIHPKYTMCSYLVSDNHYFDKKNRKLVCFVENEYNSLIPRKMKRKWRRGVISVDF